MEKATLGGGCFWCTEALFQTLPGIEKVESGYAGGQLPNPTYEDVCRGNTGHAEVIQLTYDPARISYETLLEYFWKSHDPTQLNQQDNDIGPQYRSIILTHSEEQKALAEKSKAELQKTSLKPIVTEIQPLERFYPAEAYHSNYYRDNPYQSYCRLVIKPKLEKFK